MSNSLFESLRFRLHVRNLLYDYVKKHCTIDYVTFTEGLVSEFFEDAKLVPLTDPYSLTLPVDPLDTLEKIYSKFPSYSPEEHDIMQVPQEAVAYLKEVFKTRAGKRKTERVVMSDSYGTVPPQEPFYAALTRRARETTKKLGSRGTQPCTTKELFEEHKLAVLEVEIFEEPKVDLDDTLKIKVSIDPGEQSAVKSLLHSTLDTLRSDKPYLNRHLDSTFLCSQFPAEPSYTPPEDVFMPLFPRRRHIGNSAPAAGVELASFKNLVENPSAPFEPVGVSNPDEDISRQNMVLVGGWRAIRSSPPSTPSSKGSGDDEIDELDEIRFPSSPSTTPPLVHELENSKMDQILIPRSRRIGGKGGITPHILRGKTLKTFLAPLLPQPRTEREAGHEAGRVPSPTPSSLIGQPPSVLDVDHDKETEANDYLDFDVGLEIHKVCEGYELEPDFFLDEPIDDKSALLMEVPILPQPNEFPKDFYVPNSLSDLIMPSATKGVHRHPQIDSPLYRFLKKVKGCQSLNLQLSWVPFTIEKQPPTVLEILGVVDMFPEEATEYKQALELLESVAVEPSSGPVADVSIRRGLEAGLDDDDLLYEIPTDDVRIMLNRRERSRLGKPHESTSVGEHEDSGSGNTDLDNLNSADNLQSFVSPDTNHVDAGGYSDPFNVSADTGRPLKQPRLYDQDQLLGTPFEFSDSLVAAQEDGRADELVLSENGNMIWTSPSGDLDSRMDALQSAGDGVVASPTLSRQYSGVLTDFDASSTSELSRHSLRSFDFAQLRARKVSVPHIEPAPAENVVTPPRIVERVDLPRGPPLEVCDVDTVYLAEAINPQSIHKYLACLELIQKQALVRALRSRDCAIELVERRDLDGVDLILDTDTAVVFLDLFSLPVRCRAWVERIAKASWKFERLFIVFEAYGERSAKHQRPSFTAVSPPYAYKPPIVKALKKFKRDLIIAEACGAKRNATVLQHGFADTVEEAALFTRMYGDWCEANDRTHGTIWGKRDWLDADFVEDEEENLAALRGFNHFSASILLCQITLGEFIDLLPEERVSAFGTYVLADHIRECNEDLDARLAAMQTGQDSGDLDDGAFGHSSEQNV